MSKAKSAPLLHKGCVMKSELSGATFAARLDCWVKEHTNLHFGNSVHFLDSQIVKQMMLKESYGYNTFAGLRVAELQRKTNLSDWGHIPSCENVADILTKGATPDKLGPGSVWQHGPGWLYGYAWPVSDAQLSAEQLETVRKFEKSVKPVSPVNTRSKPVQPVTLISVAGKDVWLFDESPIASLMDRCRSQNKFLNSTAFVLRFWGRKYRPLGCQKTYHRARQIWR